MAPRSRTGVPSAPLIAALVLIQGCLQASAGNTRFLSSSWKTPDSTAVSEEAWQSGIRAVDLTLKEEQLFFSRIDADLEPWRASGFTQDMIDKTYCSDLKRSFRVQIINGTIYIVGEMPGWASFNRMTKLALLEVHREFQLPDLDIFFSTADWCPHDLSLGNDTASMAPILSFSKGSNEPHCVLYPDSTFHGWDAMLLPTWEETWQLMDPQQYPPWEERNPKMFFYGSESGIRNHLKDDQTFMHDPSVDIHINGWYTQRDKHSYVSLPEHCSYRYLLNLPGHVYSSRLKYLLLCNSTVVDATEGALEFFSHMLRNGSNVLQTDYLAKAPAHPGAHILKGLERLRENPQLSQDIAAAGYDLGHRVLQPSNIRRYFARLLKEYAALQRFTPKLHPDAVPLQFSVMQHDGDMDGQGLAGRSCGKASKPQKQSSKAMEALLEGTLI